ncbi:hypothetical protein Hypma_001504 [Hypsizygus marmoreus]|uniref:Uncharacterized protein n=1 Tax=Hypsizygus marmoreus TaxID=39966 RepID=A0A369K311_HYPMA|nr:hypothetical protein Hypma_001504 [Hypsizygus marmoreus]
MLTVRGKFNLPVSFSTTQQSDRFLQPATGRPRCQIPTSDYGTTIAIETDDLGSKFCLGLTSGNLSERQSEHCFQLQATGALYTFLY